MTSQEKLYPPKREVANEADVFPLRAIEMRDIPLVVLEKFETMREMNYARKPRFIEPKFIDHNDDSQTYSIRVESAHGFKTAKELEQIYVVDVIFGRYAGGTQIAYWSQGGPQHIPRKTPYIARTKTEESIEAEGEEFTARKLGLNARRYIVGDIESKRAWGEPLHAGYSNPDALHTWDSLEKHLYAIRDKKVPLDAEHIGAYRFKKNI